MYTVYEILSMHSMISSIQCTNYDHTLHIQIPQISLIETDSAQNHNKFHKIKE